MENLVSNLLALGSAALLGGLLGLERELNKSRAGLRTHMMVALGSALFIIVGVAACGDSPVELVHVIQGLATGIGFIGAGTILKLTDRLEIIGLTTASSIWLAAAVGAACALHLFAIAGAAVALSLVILAVLGEAEKLLPKRDEAPYRTEGAGANTNGNGASSPQRTSHNSPRA